MKYISKLIVAASLAVGLTSCLKDDEHFVDFASSGYVAEIPYAANRSILRTFSVSAAKASLDTLIDVNIASPTPPTMDIPVTVAVDQAALATYNVGLATPYVLLPAGAYTLASTTVTVPAGQRTASVRMSFNSSKIPTTGGPYVLPISITAVPANVVISANYHTQLVAITLTK